MMRWILRNAAWMVFLVLLAACGSSGGGGGSLAPECVTIEAANGTALRLRDLQVTIEVRFITVSDSFFDELGVDFSVGLDDIAPGVDTSSGASNGSGTSAGADTNAIGGIANAFAIVPQGQAGLQPLPIIHPSFLSPTPGLNVTTSLGGGSCVDFGAGVLQSLGGLDPVPGGQVLESKGAGTGTGILSAVLSDIEAFEFLQAISTDGTSEVVEAPVVTLFDGQAAAVQVITETPSVANLTTEFSTRIGLMNPAIGAAETGPILSVMPTISADRTRVTLNLAPAIQTVFVRWPQDFMLGGTIQSGAMVPVIHPRGGSGSVELKSGQTLVLGGMLASDGMTVTRGVPIFADLPILGAHFRQHEQLDLRRNLLITVKARIFDSE